jgi:hypothetical protein
VTLRLDDPVTREWLKRSQLEWGAIMLMAHGYAPNSFFPPPHMSLEFEQRHKRVKDDIDDGELTQVFKGKRANIMTKIRVGDLYQYALKKVAADPDGYRWLLEFSELWASVHSGVESRPKGSKKYRSSDRAENDVKQQFEDIRREARKLDPRLSIAARAKQLSNLASLGKPSLSLLKQALANRYEPFVRRGYKFD